MVDNNHSVMFCMVSLIYKFVQLGNNPCKHGVQLKMSGRNYHTDKKKMIYSNNRLSIYIYKWRELEGTRTMLNWVKIFLFYVAVEDVSAIFVTAHTDEVRGHPFSAYSKKSDPSRAVGFNKWLNCHWMNTYRFSGVACCWIPTPSPPLRNWYRARLVIGRSMVRATLSASYKRAYLWW